MSDLRGAGGEELPEAGAFGLAEEAELEQEATGSVRRGLWSHCLPAEPGAEPLKCLEMSTFSVFKRHEMSLEETLNALLAQRDVFLVAPTGAGKSLCFQAPALISQKLSLVALTALGSWLAEVVSPLLSLMQDQVMSLKALGISAAMLSSGDSREAIIASLRSSAQ